MLKKGHLSKLSFDNNFNKKKLTTVSSKTLKLEPEHTLNPKNLPTKEKVYYDTNSGLCAGRNCWFPIIVRYQLAGQLGLKLAAFCIYSPQLLGSNFQGALGL
jgi:hypothetical protein